MIMYLAALKSVPEQLYEAAAIDGANWWQRIWYVTLPMMRNIIAITTLFSLIVTFANFDIVRILTAGGPLDHTHIFATWAFRDRHRGRRHSARRQRFAVHGADPRGRGDLHPARHPSSGKRGVMTAATAPFADAAPPLRRRKRVSMSRRPALGAALVVFLPHAVRDLFPAAADLHADHVAQDQRGDLGRHQPLVGLSAHAGKLRRAVVLENLSDILPQLGARLRLRGHDHHAHQRARRIRAVAHEILGLGHVRDRRVPHLPDPGNIAVHPAVQDVRGLQRTDRASS